MPLIAQLVEILARQNYVVLDTETTGLKAPAEVCEIALVDASGGVCFDMRVKTKFPVPLAATDVHGITTEMLATHPTWPHVREVLLRRIADKDVLVYNARFDRSIMHSSDDLYALRTNYYQIATWFCVMECFSEWNGEIHPYYGSYVWKSLEYAAKQFNITNPRPHSAAGDALTTWQLCNILRHVYDNGQVKGPQSSDEIAG